MTARLRPELAGLPVYVPGKTVPGAIKLASNETVFGPLPSVRAAIDRATDTVNRYPDNGCVQLKAALARHLGPDFAPEHVAVGCGSVSLCQQLVQVTASVGDEVVFGWRSFELYPPQVRVAGAIPIQVPLTDHTFDLYAMLAAVTDRTRLIFVCNPNNPTSTVVGPDALARFVEAVPAHILIAIDEAYVEYIRDGMRPDSLGPLYEHPVLPQHHPPVVQHCVNGQRAVPLYGNPAPRWRTRRCSCTESRDAARRGDGMPALATGLRHRADAASLGHRVHAGVRQVRAVRAQRAGGIRPSRSGQHCGLGRPRTSSVGRFDQ